MGAPEGWVGVAARGQDPLLQLSKSKFYCMWLTLLALRNRIGILMLSLAMVVLGATSLNRLPRGLFPSIPVPEEVWPPAVQGRGAQRDTRERQRTAEHASG